MVELVKSEWLDDWYVIEPSNPSVEGSRAEWLELVKRLKQGVGSAFMFRRCAFQVGPDGDVAFSSPRNSTGEGDHVVVAKADIASFVKQATAVLT